MLKGYRTYIIGAVIGISAGLHAMGFINDSLYKTIETILVGGGLMTLRASISGK